LKALQAQTSTLRADVTGLGERLHKLEQLVPKLQERISKLEAGQEEQGYWHKHWESEAEARQWAEAKLYGRTPG